MRKVFPLVMLFALSLGPGGCQKESEQDSAAPASEEVVETALRVAMVFDVGGLGDKSFNDSAFGGLLRSHRELATPYEYAEPGEGADRESHMRRYAAGEADVIIGVGLLFTDDIRKIAREFPNKQFVCIDYAGSREDPMPPNLLGLKFREEEGAFLVGAIAGLVTRSNKVGFVGGMEGPLIRKFEKGYTAGVKHVNPDCHVAVTYAGVTAEAFANPVKGKELAFSLYQIGVDIIFHASGSTGLGVFRAAEQLDRMAIGVDADQSEEARPGVILTSMIKRVDEAVFQTIRSAVEDRFEGGIQELGLKEEGLGYVYNEKNRDLIGEDNHQKIEQLKSRIIAGEIRVPKE